MSRRPAVRLFAVAAGLLVFAAFALFGRALFLGHTFAERDLGAFYYAAKWLIAPLAEASRGLPLWNPFFASGQPFAGNPEHELFHPMTTLFLLLPFEWAFRLQVIVPPLLAVPCMAFFLRVLRRSRVAALMGGLAWGLGGFTLSATCLLPELFTAVPTPLTLGFAVLVFRQASAKRVVGLAACLALQCLAGEPGTLLAVVPLLAATLVAERGQGCRSAWLWLGAGLGLGLALAAVALVPGLYHATRTLRASGLSDAMANEWSMPPVRLLELFSPHVLGHVDRVHLERYWGRGYYGGKTFAFYYSLYPGLLVSLLALRAFATRRRSMWAWAAAALFGYLLALGDRFVLWPLLRHLPGLSAIRYPEKACVVWLFATVVAAAHGCDWFLLGRARARRFLLPALGACFGAGGLLATGLSLAGSAAGPSFPVGDAVADALRVSGVALALGLALWLSRSWRRESRGLLLCGLLCLDLVTAGRPLVPTVPLAELARPPDFLRPLLRPERDDLIFHMAEWDPRHSEVGGLAKPPRPARWGLRMTLERDFDFTQLRWTYDSTRAWMEAANADQRLIEPLLERRGVTAIVRFGPGVRWENDRLVRPDGGPVVEVLFASHTNPFAFAASRVEIVHGSEGWRAQVSELGAEAARTACVEDVELASFPNPPAPADVRLRRTTPQDFTIEVDAHGPASSFIAVNQTWDPTWQVRLDGVPTRLVRTDLALSAVIVPPGMHRVTFAYRDTRVAAGLAISTVTAVGALLALLIARRRTRRRESSRIGNGCSLRKRGLPGLVQETK